MSVVEELFSAFRSEPDAFTAQALCEELERNPVPALVDEVARKSQQLFARDVDVLVAVGHLLMVAGRLSEAQLALVQAGKVQSRDPRPFNLLGEVLLRRGDALRAEKVFQRAISLGVPTSEVALGADLAKRLKDIQRRQGARSVVDEVSRAWPLPGAEAPAASDPFAAPPGPFAPPREPFATPVASSGTIGAALQATAASGGEVDDDVATRVMSQGDVLQAAAEAAEARGMRFPTADPAPTRSWAESEADSAPGTASLTPEPVAPAVPPTTEPPDLGAPPPLPTTGAGAAPARSVDAPATLGLADFAEPRGQPPAPGRLPPGTQPMPPLAGKPASLAPPPLVAATDGGATPSADALLDQLRRVGLFETDSGVLPAWEAAPRRRSRMPWVFGVAAALVVAGLSGGGYYLHLEQQKKVAAAAALDDEVEGMLASCVPARLQATKDKLGKAFELHPESQRTARLWLRNRVLSTILLQTEVDGVQQAVERAQLVDVPASEMTHGKVAFRLARGDVQGARELADKVAPSFEKDATFQLLHGSILERQGDGAALGRFEAAARLDGKLAAAPLLAAHVQLTTGKVAEGKAAVAAFRKTFGEDRVDGRALGALVWVLEGGGEELPSQLALTEQDRAELPGPLAYVPHLVDLVVALRKGDDEAALKAAEAGIAVAFAPDAAVRFGKVAVDAGNASIARRAVLAALKGAPKHTGARILSARVALLAGRFDEAQENVQKADPKVVDAVIVRAVVAYEALNRPDLKDAIGALGDAADKPMFAAFPVGLELAAGKRPKRDALKAISRRDVIWGSIVALDGAIDRGDEKLAQELISGWAKGARKRMPRADRLAMLRRLDGKPEGALKALLPAIQAKVMTPRRLVEVLFVLGALKKVKEGRQIVTQYPAVLGSYADWAKAYLDGIEGDTATAKERLVKLPEPPAGAPLPFLLLATRALALSKDARAGKVLQLALRTHPRHLDVRAAMKEL